MKIANAFDAARAEAMAKVVTNDPIGAAYNKAFGNILKREQLDKFDSAARGRLFTILKHLPAIETWRAKLEPAERMAWNHPTSIIRHWRKTTEGRAALGLPRSSGQRRPSLTAVTRENAALRERVKEVEQERDQLKRESTAQFDEPVISPIAGLAAFVLRVNSFQVDDLERIVNLGFGPSDLIAAGERMVQIAEAWERSREKTKKVH